jgi:hypothetical protein
VHGARRNAGEVLEEPVQLVEVPVGDRQERRRVGLAGRRARHRAQVELQLLAEALDAPRDAHEVSPVEAGRRDVGVPEHARRDRARAVAQLQRQVRRPRTRHQPLLADAGEHAVDLVPGAQGGNGDRGVGGCGDGFHHGWRLG